MRTIFGKQLLLYLGTLIISFVLLGAVLGQVINNYFTSQRVTSLKDSARRISRLIQNAGEYGISDTDNLSYQINSLYQYLNAQVMIIGVDYNIIAPDVSGEIEDVYIPELEPLMAGQEVVIHGTFNGAYAEPLLTVGCPMYLGDRVAGAVLASMSMAELESAVLGMYQAALICLGIAALFASVLIYLSCRAISKPLWQINEAAGVIAAGNFEKHIEVKSKDEVGQLARQFNSMAESLQEQEKIRRAFIANLSHDMRSPLTSMRGFLEALNDGTVPPERQQYYLGIVMDESDRLIKLLNDMLDIHRLEDGLTAKFSEFELNALIRKTVMGFEKRALDKKIMINCSFAHPEDIVKADGEMLRRVLYNLLDNALKFTQEGGEITVETTDNDKKLAIAVSDNGRGMTEEEQKRAFDRFFKGDPSRSEDKMGSGLGLSIVREFIRAHGEQVNVKSELGKGSTFSFTLQKHR